MTFVKWWTLPRNYRSCFNVFELSSFIMSSDFVTNGVIPFGLILNPSHSSILFSANSHFCRLIARPSLSDFLSTLSSFVSVLILFPW